MDNHGEEEEESEPEGGAVNLMGDNTGDEDSSEEEDEGSDAEREVRKGQSCVPSLYRVRARHGVLGVAQRCGGDSNQAAKCDIDQLDNSQASSSTRTTRRARRRSAVGERGTPTVLASVASTQEMVRPRFPSFPPAAANSSLRPQRLGISTTTISDCSKRILVDLSEPTETK